MSLRFAWLVIILLLASSWSVGCSSSTGGDNLGIYKATMPEPDWIRNGDPIEFEGDLWYPKDNVDILLDSEVFPAGEYRGVPLYVQKLDVRPYSRIYSKFDKNKFRVFEPKGDNDQSKKAF